MELHKPALASSLKNTYQKAMEHLRDNAGPTFDKTYMSYEINMHQQSVDLVTDRADSVSDPQFQRFLQESRSEFLGHLEAAQSVQRQTRPRQ